jgi:predicted phage terminase large subunit-like protein
MSIDPALTESKGADFSAITVISVDPNNTWYIRDIWRGQVLPSALIEQIFRMDAQWKPVSIALETTAFQKILQYQIYDEMRKRNRFLPIKEIKHGGMHSDSKEERIKSLQPRYEQKLVKHPERQSVPLVEYLEDELSRFPKGQNDDIIDSLAQVNQIAFPRKIKEQRKQYQNSVYPA